MRGADRWIPVVIGRSHACISSLMCDADSSRALSPSMSIRRRFPLMHSTSVLTGHYNAFFPRLSAAAKAQLQQEADLMATKAIHKSSMASLKARVESFTHVSATQQAHTAHLSSSAA